MAEAAPHHNSPSEDPNSPFFLHHSDNVNTVVVTPHLTGPNYLSWNRSFTLAISIKNKLGFLDGTIETPQLNNTLYVPWLRCNNLILSWILNSISKEIASNVLYVSSAKEVWEKLKARFAQPDNVRIYRLQQQLGSITQGTQPVTDYFTQLNAVWEELHNYRPLPHCSCGLCTCKTLDTVGEIQQTDTEERQRQVRTFALPLNESSVLAVYHGQNKKKEKLEVTCYHCGKMGHTKEKCYRLVGFPPNFKFTKSKQGYSSGSHSVNQVTTQEHESRTSKTPQLPLTEAQIQQIATLVNAQTSQLNLKERNSPINPLSNDFSTSTNAQTHTHHSSNMAGPIFMDDDWSC
ncbi:uncharacterized protein LOC122316414 [Carya illinoinensis]|uniref:uncharacterized protein LOC122316414 n=1 Tax=Carya illinoinensis TaxID=32201 RepID=UPI001C71CF73|nr:uncharacterized protein LOC122316414 [Carya illinoinensis]